MAEHKARETHATRTRIFELESEPIPPGTKSRAKLPRGEELLQEPSSLRWWLIGAGAITAALAVGILIGRFLLP